MFWTFKLIPDVNILAFLGLAAVLATLKNCQIVFHLLGQDYKLLHLQFTHVLNKLERLSLTGLTSLA
jgi:hypothetical protein